MALDTTLCLICGLKPAASVDYEDFVKVKQYERILVEYPRLEDAWEMLKGVQFFREYKWLHQETACLCLLCIDKVVSLAAAVHDITSLLDVKEKEIEKKQNPDKSYPVDITLENNIQLPNKSPPSESLSENEGDDSVFIGTNKRSISQQSRRRPNQLQEAWITNKQTSQNTGKKVAASSAGKSAAKAVPPSTSRQTAAPIRNTKARSKSLGRILPVTLQNTCVPANKGLYLEDKDIPLAQARARRSKGRSIKERNPDFTGFLIKGGDSNSNSTTPSETGSNFDEEVTIIHQTAQEDVILEQVVNKAVTEYAAPPTPTPTPSPEILLQDNVQNTKRPVSFNPTTMIMSKKRTIFPTIKKRESTSVTNSATGQSKNKSTAVESQPKEKYGVATDNLKQTAANPLAVKRPISSDTSAAAEILPAKRARAPSAKMLEADSEGFWMKIAGSEESKKVDTSKVTRRSAPVAGTFATFKSTNVPINKDNLENWKSQEFRAQQLSKLNKVLNEGKWGIRSGDNMEKEVFKTAASKEAYLQGIAKLVSHFGGRTPISPPKAKQNKVASKTALPAKERRRSKLPRPINEALDNITGKEVDVPDSKNINDKDITDDTKEIAPQNIPKVIHDTRRKSLAVIRTTNIGKQVPLQNQVTVGANPNSTQAAKNMKSIPKVEAKPPLEPLLSTKSNETKRRRSVPAVQIGKRKPVMTRKSAANFNDVPKQVLARKSMANETQIDGSKPVIITRKTAVSADNIKTTDILKENHLPLTIIDEDVQINDNNFKDDENKNKISSTGKKILDKNAKKKMQFKKVKTIPQKVSDKVPLSSASKAVNKTEKRNILKGRERQICSVCGILQGAAEYVNHLKKEHGGGRCSKCPRVFSTEKDINLHITQNHQNPVNKTNSQKSIKITAKKSLRSSTVTKKSAPNESHGNSRPLPLNVDTTHEESKIGCDFSLNDTYGENWNIKPSVLGITAIAPKPVSTEQNKDNSKSETATQYVANVVSKDGISSDKVFTEITKTRAGPSKEKTKAKFVVKKSATGKVGKRYLEDASVQNSKTGVKSTKSTKVDVRCDKAILSKDKYANDGNGRPQRNVRSLQERIPDFVISDEYNTKLKHNSQDEKSSDNEKKSVNIVKDAEVKLNSLKPGKAPVFNRIVNETVGEDESSNDADLDNTAIKPDSSGCVKLTSTPYPHADNDITNKSPNTSIIFPGILSVNEESRDVNNDDTVPIGNDEDNTKQDTLTSGSNVDQNTTKDGTYEDTLKAADKSLESADESNEGDRWFSINQE